MSSEFNVLLHGAADEVAEHLEAGGDFNLELIRPALTNAFRKLEKLQDQLESEASRLEMQIDRVSGRLDDLEHEVRNSL